MRSVRDARTRPAADRRTALADAAIAILATEGSRGLTHRAVDRVLELPQGSTSAYLRTRASLFIAATNRLAELDRASVDDLASTLQAGTGDAPPGQLIAAIVDAWTAPSDAARQLARIELQLEAARTPEVGQVLAMQRSAFIGLTRTMLESAVWQPPSAATDLEAIAGVVTALVDGLIADRLLHRRTAVPAEELAEAVAQLLPTTAERGAR